MTTMVACLLKALSIDDVLTFQITQLLYQSFFSQICIAPSLQSESIFCYQSQRQLSYVQTPCQKRTSLLRKNATLVHFNSFRRSSTRSPAKATPPTCQSLLVVNLLTTLRVVSRSPTTRSPCLNLLLSCPTPRADPKTMPRNVVAATLVQHLCHRPSFALPKSLL